MLLELPIMLLSIANSQNKPIMLKIMPEDFGSLQTL